MTTSKATKPRKGIEMTTLIIAVFVLANFYGIALMIVSARNDRRAKAAIKKMARRERN